MKRELKPCFPRHRGENPGYNCRAYPDEKGIETRAGRRRRAGPEHIAEPIPMKRELKPPGGLVLGDEILEIAEPIPMKRELKHVKHYLSRILRFPNCRAYPDEKGIETPANMDDRIFRGQALQSLSR